MPPAIRLIATDLDGTLLTPLGQLSPRTIAALHAAQAAGVPLVFATGRRQSFALQVLAPASLQSETLLITSNGAVTRTLSGTLMDRHLMPVATAQQLCHQLAEFRNAMLFTFDRVGPGAMVVEELETLHRSIAHWVESNAHEIARVSPLDQAFALGDAPVQGMICASIERMAAALAVLDADPPTARELRAAISIHRTEYAHRDLSIVDLLPVNSSKGYALARVAASLGIAAADVMAIGDNLNDAEMLAWCGHPVVMANAAAELRAQAVASGWHFTASHHEDGAAQIIEAAIAGDFPLRSTSF